MNLESSIKDVISKKLEDGSIEKLIEQQLEKGVVNALDSLFRSYGDVTKVIEEKIKSVMVPYLESYDYSKYLVKLDDVLVEVLKNSALENKKLLENFKELMIPEERKVIKASELFDIWTKFVAENVETDGLDVDYDDGVSYVPVEVSMEVEYEDSRDWSSFEYAKLILECEHDEKMNFEISISRYKKDKEKKWDIHYRNDHELRNLRYLDKFEILLMRLDQTNVKLELDTDYESDEITPEKEPEASWS